MKPDAPIDIDLLAFFKTGKFDYIKIGQTKEWILNNFPNPDGFVGFEDQITHDTWCYGNIEFHFKDNSLFLIYSEGISELDGGHSLRLDKWIFSNPENLTLSYVIEQLNIQRIDFTKKAEKLEVEYVRLLLTESDIRLSFIPSENLATENQNHFMLSAFSLLAR